MNTKGQNDNFWMINYIEQQKTPFGLNAKLVVFK